MDTLTCSLGILGQSIQFVDYRVDLLSLSCPTACSILFSAQGLMNTNSYTLEKLHVSFTVSYQITCHGDLSVQPVANTTGCGSVKLLYSIHPANVFWSKFCSALLHAKSSIFPVDLGSQPSVHAVIIQREKYEVNVLNMHQKESILALRSSE